MQNNIQTSVKNQKLDNYEKEILAEIHSGESKKIPNMSFYMQNMQKSAQSFVKMKRKSIHIRIPEYNLTRIRNQAEKKGLPYQTFINSILQQYLEKSEKSPII